MNYRLLHWYDRLVLCLFFRSLNTKVIWSSIGKGDMAMISTANRAVSSFMTSSSDSTRRPMTTGRQDLFFFSNFFVKSMKSMILSNFFCLLSIYKVFVKQWSLLCSAGQTSLKTCWRFLDYYRWIKCYCLLLIIYFFVWCVTHSCVYTHNRVYIVL